MKRNSAATKARRLAFSLARRVCVVAGLAGGAMWALCASGQNAHLGDSLVEHRYVAFDVAPDGEHVVFAAADADLYLLNLHTLKVSRLTKTALLETTPTFSPDGKNVVYAAGSGGNHGFHLFSLAVASKRVTPITTGSTVSDFMPRFSRDGKRIVFARAHRIRPYSMGGWTQDDYDACIVSSKGGVVRRITHRHYYQQSRPQFLTQNTLVYGAMGTYPDTATYLWKANVATGQTKPLTPRANPATNYNVLGTDPAVAPNGHKVVFLSDRFQSYAYDLLVMNADGTNQRPLHVTKISRYNQNPVFMPDGRSILYLAGLSSNAGARPIFSLWQVNINGSKPHQIAGSGLFSHPLTWKRGT